MTPSSTASAEHDPTLAVLVNLHECRTDVPADVGLSWHSDDGCRCGADRFVSFLSIGPIDADDTGHPVVMADDDGEQVEIRTGPHTAVRFNDEHWLRLPDLASACWYIATIDRIKVSEVDDSRVGQRCLKALAKLGATTDNVFIGDTEYHLDGTVLLPDTHDVPDDLVVDQYESEDSGGPGGGDTVYLIEADGAFYFGGGDMDWTKVGPFASTRDARAWFDAETDPLRDE